MADYFPGLYWADRYFATNYWQGGVDVPGAMRAHLAGSGAVTALVHGVGYVSVPMAGSGSVVGVLVGVGGVPQPAPESHAGGFAVPVRRQVLFPRVGILRAHLAGSGALSAKLAGPVDPQGVVATELAYREFRRKLEIERDDLECLLEL